MDVKRDDNLRARKRGPPTVFNDSQPSNDPKSVNKINQRSSPPLSSAVGALAVSGVLRTKMRGEEVDGVGGLKPPRRLDSMDELLASSS